MADEFDNDIVLVKSRVPKETIGVMHNSRFREIPAKGLKLPRGIATLAVEQNAFRWNGMTGGVKDSKCYIVDDIGTPLGLPSEPVDMEELKRVQQTDGLGKDKIMVDGKLIGKQTINLDPQGEDKENFAGNNR